MPKYSERKNQNHDVGHFEQTASTPPGASQAERDQWLKGLQKLKEIEKLNQLGLEEAGALSGSLQEIINNLYPLALSIAQNIQSPEEFNELLDFAELSIKAGHKPGEVGDKSIVASPEVIVGIQDLRKEIEKIANHSHEPGQHQKAEEEINLTVLGSLIYQAVREALSKNTFQQLEGSPWPTALLQRGNSRGQAQLRPASLDDQPLVSPGEVEKWSQLMWKQREELSDLDADALDLLSHAWLQQAKAPGHYAVADVDQFLSMRGLKPKQSGDGRRGGYEPEQRAEMLKALSHIQNLWLNMGQLEMYEERSKGGRKQRVVKQDVQSKAFVITDRMGQLSLDGYMDVRRFIFQPGHLFSHYLFGPGRQTALLSAKAVQYDPYRQKWEKRLARYLSWQWRSQARRGEYMRPYRVITLLEAIGEEVNQRYPSKTRERLEKALDLLQRDEVIAAWQYDRWDENVMEKRGWIEIWKEATVLIEPPEVIRETYKSIERPAETVKATLNEGKGNNREWQASSLSERIRLRRKELGLSQLEAAEQLEIAQSYLSKLERALVEPSSDIKKRLQKWLEGR
ncbi:MAG TPA: helix-turn-helix transcriptional regulator [Chloroflexia bacterium]|nr:helix-turn-helix transcriptional regulator [Chloroflexia bacterium]